MSELLKKIDYALRKDSLSDAERIASARQLVSQGLSDPAPSSGEPAEKWAKSEAESVYPDPFASVYSEEESQENSTAASQREAFVEGANWARGVLTQSAASTVEPVAYQLKHRLASTWTDLPLDQVDAYKAAQREKIEAGDIVIRPLYAAPSTSPEPDAVRAATESCKGEHLRFEEWASGAGYDMHEHPLHYLFLDEKTNAARQGWKAALVYIGNTLDDALSRPAHGGWEDIIEQCAKAVEAEAVGQDGEPLNDPADISYNFAIEHAAAAVRALARNDRAGGAT